jgi:hypothetical protein
MTVPRDAREMREKRDRLKGFRNLSSDHPPLNIHHSKFNILPIASPLTPHALRFLFVAFVLGA